MVSLATIFSWFETGDFPTEQQFQDTFSSFFHKSEKIPATQIEGLLAIFVEKRGFDSLVHPKHFRWKTSLTVSSVILSGNASGASFTVAGVDYNETTLVGVTIPVDTDLIINDIVIITGFDTGSMTIIF